MFLTLCWGSVSNCCLRQFFSYMITNWHYPELRGYSTLKSLLHSGLKQVMSLFTLGSTRTVLVVALVYSFPDVFNVIMVVEKVITSKFRFYLIAIYVLGCFRNFSCTPVTVQNYLEEPSESMNFNVIDIKNN